MKINTTSLIKIIFSLIVFIFISGLSKTADAQGEIINVNYQYQIAFTDLNNTSLNVNDIVGLYKSGKLVGYLKVVDTTPVISKLVTIKNDPKYPAPKNFRDITIGTSVIKTSGEIAKEPMNVKPDPIAAPQEKQVNKPSESPDNFQFQKEIHSQLSILSKNYADLSANYSNLSLEKQKLEDDHSAAQNRISELQGRLFNLEKEIADYKQQLSTLNQQKSVAIDNQCRNEIQRLNGIINQLKEKFLRIDTMLNEGRASNER